MFSTFSTSSPRSKKPQKTFSNHHHMIRRWAEGRNPVQTAKSITVPRSYQQRPAARRFWFGGLAHPSCCWGLKLITYNMGYPQNSENNYDHLRLSLLQWYPQFFLPVWAIKSGVDIIPASSIAKLLLLVIAPKSRDFSRRRLVGQRRRCQTEAATGKGTPRTPKKAADVQNMVFGKRQKKGTTSEDAGIKEIQREYRNVKYVKWWEPEEEYKNLRYITSTTSWEKSLSLLRGVSLTQWGSPGIFCFLYLFSTATVAAPLMEDACHSLSEGDSACLSSLKYSSCEPWSSKQSLPRLNITANPSGLPGPLQLGSLLRCRFAVARDFGPLDLKLENMPGFVGQLPPRDAAP